VPRDPAGTFEPQIVRKGQTRLEGFNERIIALYARGMTTRDIRAHLREMYDVDVSADLISRVTDGVLQELAEWQSRPLDRAWFLGIVANAPERRCSDATWRQQPDACGSKAPVLRADPVGPVGVGSVAAGGGVGLAAAVAIGVAGDGSGAAGDGFVGFAGLVAEGVVGSLGPVRAAGGCRR